MSELFAKCVTSMVMILILAVAVMQISDNWTRQHLAKACMSCIEASDGGRGPCCMVCGTCASCEPKPIGVSGNNEGERYVDDAYD
mgnify:CR=1 FL=1